MTSKRCLQICLLVFGLALTLSAQAGASGGFRFALTGDSLISMRVSVFDEPGYLQMFDRIRKADAAFTNFEMLIHDFGIPGAPVSGGTYMGAPPFVLDELKWAGFNLFNLATNHSFDFGAEGFQSTLRAFERAGVVYAGAGQNLGRARAPGYLETKKGRVALIAACSTFSILSPAGEQRTDVPGRPGLSPLRFQTTYTVDPATLAGLRAAAGSSGGGEELRFLGATFRSGDKSGSTTTADPNDLKGLVAFIRDARRQADWVVASLHSHENGTAGRLFPPDFAVAYAHAAIDAGADVFVGHGPHLLRGIEIYKGKPIFYSIGNFIFQNDTIRFQPQENYASLGLPLTATPSEYFDARSANDTRSYPAEPEFWKSVVVEAVFNSNHEVTEIDLYPISLGFKQSRAVRGRPLPADPQLAREIIENIVTRSEPWKTKITLEGNKGVWRAGAQAGSAPR